MLFVTKAKKIAKQEKTDGRVSYRHESKYVKERRKVYVPTLLIQQKMVRKSLLHSAGSNTLWTPMSANLYICALLLRHSAIAFQTPI